MQAVVLRLLSGQLQLARMANCTFIALYACLYILSALNRTWCVLQARARAGRQAEAWNSRWLKARSLACFRAFWGECDSLFTGRAHSA
eukprot:4628388-Pleurochrysis_carterae.AAC.1